MFTRRALGLSLLAALALGASPSDSHAGACAQWPGRVMLVTPTDQDIPPDGAIVLVVQDNPNGQSPFDGEAFPTATYLTQGATRIELRLETLAPGLARLVPVRPPAPGTWTLHGSARPVTVRFGAAAMPAPAAPAVRRLRMLTHNPGDGPLGGIVGMHGPRTWQTVDLELRGRLPARTYAVIARWGGPTDAPALFEPVLAGTPVTTLWTSSYSRCGYVRPGVIAPTLGRSGPAALRFVDTFGRVSADTSVALAVAR